MRRRFFDFVKDNHSASLAAPIMKPGICGASMLLLVSASFKLHPTAQLVHDKRLFLHREIGHRPSALIDQVLDFTRLLDQRVVYLRRRHRPPQSR
jgi:hypothetical protein